MIRFRWGKPKGNARIITPNGCDQSIIGLYGIDILPLCLFFGVIRIGTNRP